MKQKLMKKVVLALGIVCASFLSVKYTAKMKKASVPTMAFLGIVATMKIDDASQNGRPIWPELVRLKVMKAPNIMKSPWAKFTASVAL